MAIDPAHAVGAELPPFSFSWDPDRVILYHLGIGSGNPPTSSVELRYCYEGSLQVLPTFATIPLFPGVWSLGEVEGLDLNPAMVLHGEHEVVLARPLPTSGSVTTRGRVKAVYDKGNGAVVVAEFESVDESGPLFLNRASLFVRGEGGFGGDPGPAPGHLPPPREPDHVVESLTLPQQALLYRLSGDKNPLHADPAFAAFGGFERPILHGLCSFGMACKAVVDAVYDGVAGVVGGIAARFSGVVFPGETLVTRMWKEGGEVILDVACKERGTRVLSNAAVWER